MIDRITLVARLQVQRRATVVAELSTDWISVVAEGAHLVAIIGGARGDGPGAGGQGLHAGILSRRKEFASDLMKVLRHCLVRRAAGGRTAVRQVPASSFG